MINLLPEIEKNKLKKVHTMKVVALSMYLLALVGVSGAVFLLPTFVLSESKENTLIEKLVTLKKNNENDKSDTLDNVIDDINSKLKVFPENSEFIFSEDVLAQILSKKTKDISITSVSYIGTGSDLEISIVGKASNRDVLLNFERDLASVPQFIGIQLPISNFLSNNNIDFIINGTFKK